MAVRAAPHVHGPAHVLVCIVLCVLLIVIVYVLLIVIVCVLVGIDYYVFTRGRTYGRL